MHEGPLFSGFPHLPGIPHSNTVPSQLADEDGGRVSPHKKSAPGGNGGGILNGSLGQEEAKDRIKNALKQGTRSFTKASSDLFHRGKNHDKTKSKSKKKLGGGGGRGSSSRHSTGLRLLAVPQGDGDAGETTTDFDEDDEEDEISSNDGNLLPDEGNNIMVS